MMHRTRVPLTAPYQPLALVEDVDQRRGRVRYAFRGPRAAGALTIDLDHHGADQAITRRVHVRFGDDGAGIYSEDQRPHLPVVNGVPLVGGVVLDPADFLARDQPRLTFRRPTGRHTSCSAPEATSRYACAIVVALLRRWYERPDREELIRAAARHAAAGRLRALYRYTITPTRDRIEQLQRELQQHQLLASELCQLAGEYHDRHHDQDTTAAANCAEHRSA